MNFIAWLVMDKVNQNEISYLFIVFETFILIKDEILPFLNYYVNALKVHVNSKQINQQQ